MSFLSESIYWGLSTKRDGPMKLTADSALDFEAILNRKKFFNGLELDFENIVSACLVHGTRVAVVTDRERSCLIPAADGLVTDQPDVVLTVTVADCVPIFFFDPKRRVIGIAHSGWKGTLNNIAEEMVEIFHDRYAVNPADVQVCIGAHIQAHHFEVKEDVAQQFKKYSQWCLVQDDKIFIDLGSIIKNQLLEAGLLMENIECDMACTFCEKEMYFSFRRDKPEKLEAMLAYIGFKKI